MSEEKKNTPDNQHEIETQKEKKKKRNDLDRELRQTFPASDPPSRSRPGSDRSKDDKS